MSTKTKPAKCSVCESKRGKRFCLITDTLICPLCCGKTRSADACTGCEHYKAPVKNYRSYPAYTISEMEDSWELQDSSECIEGALVDYDILTDEKLQDDDALEIFEIFMDQFHLKEKRTPSSPLIQKAIEHINEAIDADLEDKPREEITKVLGTIHFVCNRRCKTKNRNYMRIIHQHVGRRTTDGSIVQTVMIGNKEQSIIRIKNPPS